MCEHKICLQLNSGHDDQCRKITYTQSTLLNISHFTKTSSHCHMSSQLKKFPLSISKFYDCVVNSNFTKSTIYIYSVEIIHLQGDGNMSNDLCYILLRTQKQILVVYRIKHEIIRLKIEVGIIYEINKKLGISTYPQNLLIHFLYIWTGISSKLIWKHLPNSTTTSNGGLCKSMNN